MIPKLWSPVKVAYDRNDEQGISHWGPKRQLFYISQINRISKHDVYSTMKILSVLRVKVDQRLGYGYLEEIVVRRADRQEYTFKEGNFSRHHLNDIEDMLLLHVQNKLFNLPGDDIINMIIALRMFTRSLVIKKRVKDAQLGILHNRLLNFELGYNKDMPNRKWTEKDQNRTDIMVKLIDKQLLERRIMRSLEGLVGGRKVETDYRLLLRTPEPEGSTQTELALKQTQQGTSNEVLEEAFQGRLFDSFQDKEKYEHVDLKVTRSQEGKRSQDDDKR
ncbi:hypothetical protein Tco_1506952 [Tanacetum coccineum]